MEKPVLHSRQGSAINSWTMALTVILIHRARISRLTIPVIVWWRYVYFDVITAVYTIRMFEIETSCNDHVYTLDADFERDSYMLIICRYSVMHHIAGIVCLVLGINTIWDQSCVTSVQRGLLRSYIPIPFVWMDYWKSQVALINFALLKMHSPRYEVCDSLFAVWNSTASPHPLIKLYNHPRTTNHKGKFCNAWLFP